MSEEELTPEHLIQALIDDEGELEDSLIRFSSQKNYLDNTTERVAETVNKATELLHEIVDSLTVEFEYSDATMLVLLFLMSEAGFYNIGTNEVLILVRTVLIAQKMGLLFDEEDKDD